MQENFHDMIGEPWTSILSGLEITTPTTIQSAVIPKMQDGKDLIFTSETGSGKTLAYVLPILKQIDPTIKAPQAFILLPTQELAYQVYKQIDTILNLYENKIGVALLVGNANIKRQIESLKAKPKIIVGTAARIIEIISLKKLTGHFIKTIVIDEADRMLDDKNIAQIKQIIKTTLRERQIVLASASMQDHIFEFAKESMKEYTFIKPENASAIPKNIEHIFITCGYKRKVETLRSVLHSYSIDKAIVFINSPFKIEELSEKLNFHQIKAMPLYGTAQKEDRKKALHSFKYGNTQVLVASDIASRGLDIKDLKYVINLDIPEDATIYLHRAGRAGRMGKEGFCINLALENEQKFLSKVSKKFQIDIKEVSLFKGKAQYVTKK